MAGALEIARDERRRNFLAKQAAKDAAKAEAKNAGGPPENKGNGTARVEGLALPSSRFSSKTARVLSVEAKLLETDFNGVTPSGQQDRYTIEDVKAIIARKQAGNGSASSSASNDGEEE